MRSLTIGIVMFVVTLIFVNIMLFGLLGINASSVPVKTLLIVEGAFGGFFVFLFLIATKKF